MFKQYLPYFTGLLLCCSLFSAQSCRCSIGPAQLIKPVQNGYKNLNGVLYPTKFIDDAELRQKANSAVQYQHTKSGDANYKWVACRVPLGEIRGSASLGNGAVGFISEDASFVVFDPFKKTTYWYPQALARSFMSRVSQPEQYVSRIERTIPGQFVAFRACYGDGGSAEAYRLTLGGNMELLKESLPAENFGRTRFANTEETRAISRDGRYAAIVNNLEVQVIDSRSAKMVAHLPAGRFKPDMALPESIKVMWLPELKEGKQSLIVYGTMVGSLESIVLEADVGAKLDK